MSLTVHRLTLNPVAVNCYILSDHTRQAAIVDCGALTDSEFEQIEAYIADNRLEPRLSLLTHAHFDHVFGIARLCQRYGLPPQCHPLELPVYQANPRLALALAGVPINLPPAELSLTLADGQSLTLGTLTINVIHTPGHTPGGLCFHIPDEGVLLSGDTLFRGSLGRTDTPLGNWQEELQSVRQRLLTLPPSTIVLPGHGPATTIDGELLHNPYL